MIAIWFGKLTLDEVRDDRIEVIGPRRLCDQLRSWLLLSPIILKNDRSDRRQPGIARELGQD
jgi:hypothetical protein